MTSLTRQTGAERMDAADVDAAALDRSLADLRAVNRWLGGWRVVLHHLAPMLLRRAHGPIRILDVATGSGDIPRSIAAWARAHHIDVRIVATDLHPQTLELARRHLADEPAITVEEADALALPYAADAFDFALCSTALHHFDDDADAVRVLRELDRVAVHGWVVNDLTRSRLALLGAGALAATVWRRHPVTAHDGPLSVRRSFTAPELAELARNAGLAGVRVHRHLPFRVALVADRTAAA